MRRRRVGGVLAALCAAAGALGLLAIGLLAPPSKVGLSSSSGASRSGWPIAGAFSAPGEVGWLAEDAFTSNESGATPPAPAATPPIATPAESFVSRPSGPSVAGEATGYGCAAALAYLSTYAAPGFWLVCPGDAKGHQAMTACYSGASQCSDMRLIVIADPCPAAYMNEASNSWAVMGESDAPIDPYGSCA